MASNNVSQCRGCPASIIWVQSGVSQAKVCLNAEPDPVRGNYVIREDGKAYVVKRDQLFEPDEKGPFYLSHFATCPASASFRTKNAHKSRGKK